MYRRCRLWTPDWWTAAESSGQDESRWRWWSLGTATDALAWLDMVRVEVEGRSGDGERERVGVGVRGGGGGG